MLEYEHVWHRFLPTRDNASYLSRPRSFSFSNAQPSISWPSPRRQDGEHFHSLERKGSYVRISLQGSAGQNESKRRNRTACEDFDSGLSIHSSPSIKVYQHFWLLLFVKITRFLLYFKETAPIICRCLIFIPLNVIHIYSLTRKYIE